MAIFPVFKFTSMSKSGQQLYERMNREGDEIDMLGFDSAVKTGAPAVQQKLVSNENQLTTLNNLDAVVPQVQSLDNLRLQLNTDAHEAMERGLGTQFVKIGFSNVLAQATYQGKSGQRRIEEIFSAINALTLMGARKIRQQYYNTDGSVNQQAIQELMQRISKSNQLGVSFDEILSANGVIASLNLRSTFEQSVISSINRDVIDVNTHGGAAVQQSTFGFVGYNKDSIYSLEDTLNGGAELKWNKQNGSMEVMLSANFFRHVLPKEIKTYKAQRQWLINHDFINGFKSLSYGVVVNKEDEAQHEINKKLFNYVFFSHDTSEESPQYVSKTLENFLADI